MTCEVMLMNLDAVAFAADSAITITETDDRGRERKRYVEGEKAFILEQHGPIAAIIYDGVEYCGRTGWAHVLRRFSEQLAGTPDTVADASDHLRDYLLSAEEELIGPDVPDQMFAIYVCHAVLSFFRLSGDIERYYGADQAVDRALEIFEQGTRNVYDPDNEQLVPRKIVGTLTPQLTRLIAETLRPLIEDTLKALYEDDVPQGLEGRLIPLIEASLLTDWIPRSAPQTGLVLAGFGKRDRTPAFVHLNIFGDMGGVLKHRRVEARSTNPRGEPYIARSFAMDDAVTAFLQGVHPGARRFLEENIRAMMDGTFNSISEVIRDKAPALSDEIEAIMSDARFDGPNFAIENATREHEHHLQIDMGDLASLAGPEKLADRAHSLLKLVVIEHELTASRSVAQPVSLLHMRRGRAVLSHA